MLEEILGKFSAGIRVESLKESREKMPKEIHKIFSGEFNEEILGEISEEIQGGNPDGN